MEKVKNKNIISVVLLIVMLFLIGGISYAAYTYVNTGGANTINTGQITMSYAEPSNALEIQEALPISDTNGKEQANYFEFTVTTHATTNADDTSGIIIPYEINIEKLENSYYCTDNINQTEDTCTGEWIQRPELGNDKVKVYLTKVENNEEEELVTKKISELPESTLNGVASYIYSTSDLHRQAEASKTTIYRLRIWIDEETNPSLFNGKEEYRLRVNINSNTGPISQLDNCFTNNGSVITDYNELCGLDVVIPSSINGTTITEIEGATTVTTANNKSYKVQPLANGKGAFEDKNITSVVIPNTITEIGEKAFYNNNLVKVAIPSSVTEIKENAFGSNETLEMISSSSNATLDWGLILTGKAEEEPEIVIDEINPTCTWEGPYEIENGTTELEYGSVGTKIYYRLTCSDISGVETELTKDDITATETYLGNVVLKKTTNYTGVGVSGKTYTFEAEVLAEGGRGNLTIEANKVNDLSGRKNMSSTSNDIVLLVLPTITAQPSNKTETIGNKTTFNINVTQGIPTTINYQWQVSTNGTIWTNINTATSNSYEIETITSTMNGNKYRCLISNIGTPNAEETNTIISSEVTLTAQAAVAKIGTTNYSTIGNAIAAVPASTQTTVELLTNTTECNITIPSNKNVVLDLKGKTITCGTSNNNTITNNGTLEVKDTGTNGSIVNTTYRAISSTGTTTISSGIVKGSQYGIYTNGGTLNIGSTTNNNIATPKIYGTSTTNSYGIYRSSGTVNYYNGSIYTRTTGLTTAIYGTPTTRTGYKLNTISVTEDSLSYKKTSLVPECTLSVPTGVTSSKVITLTTTASKLASSPHSFTSASSGYSTANTRTITANGTYNAWIKDSEGNVGTCSLSVTSIGLPTITSASYDAANAQITVVLTNNGASYSSYYISTTNSQPAANASGWVALTETQKTAYSFVANQYTKGTYYIWVKDTSENVSAVKSAVVTRTYLYLTGNTMSALTGGYTLAAWNGVTWANSGGNLWIWSNHNTTMINYTVNKINVSNYSSLKFEHTRDIRAGGYNNGVGLSNHNTPPTGDPGFVSSTSYTYYSLSTTPVISTFNLSSYSGSYYIAMSVLWGTGGGTGFTTKISRIWME